MATFPPARRKSFYARLTVPLSLRHYFNGRSEVWRSLKTLDKEEARVRSDKWEASGRELFHVLKRHGERITKDEIEALVERWLESELDEAEDYRAVCGPVLDDYRDEVTSILADQRQEVFESLVSCDYRKIERKPTS